MVHHSKPITYQFKQKRRLKTEAIQTQGEFDSIIKSAELVGIRINLRALDTKKALNERLMSTEGRYPKNAGAVFRVEAKASKRFPGYLLSTTAKTLLEAIDTTTGIKHFLLTSIERVTC